MSAFFWGYTPAQIAGGYLSDCYGGELVLGYAAIIWSLCTFVVPFLPAGQLLFFPPIAVVMLSRVCTGLSQGNLLFNGRFRGVQEGAYVQVYYYIFKSG